MGLVWGIDLGGTKVEGVICSSDNLSAPLVRERIPTESELGYEHVLAQIQKLLQGMSHTLGAEAPSRIGFGTPGTLDPDRQTLKNSNTLCLNGQPLKRDLEQLLGVEAVLSNDANCFALAEAVLGAGRNARCVFGVIPGTGAGGGIAFDGEAWGGRQGNAGEWGHNPLLPGGAACYCGKSGCVEQKLSVSATPLLGLEYHLFPGG